MHCPGQENLHTVERHTLLDFAVSATSHRGDSVLSQLARLHGLVVPGRALSGRGILAALAAQLKVRRRTEAILPGGCNIWLRLQTKCCTFVICCQNLKNNMAN